MPKIDGGLQFDDCFKRRSISSIKGIPISVIGLEDLIASKKVTGRKKDFENIEQLERLQKNSKVKFNKFNSAQKEKAMCRAEGKPVFWFEQRP